MSNKICLHCKDEKLELVATQVIRGDKTCCGEKPQWPKASKCRQKDHINYICRTDHIGLYGTPIGHILITNEN